MLVYAGIDEAGYGPILGPLVIVRSVFVLEDHCSLGECPPLWALLKSVVCKDRADKGRRIAINDSKLLYRPAGGVQHLERCILSFLGANGCNPECLDELLRQLAFDDESMIAVQPWYAGAGGTASLPVAVQCSDLLATSQRLAEATTRLRIRLADVNAAVVFEDRFNRLVAAGGSKAVCAWEFVSGHLRSIWNQFRRHQIFVAVDRQGGRKYYANLLRATFPEVTLEVLEEADRTSRYRIASGDGSMHIIVQVKGDMLHLPVAFASMTAKYVRELLMMRFQAFWKTHAPGVKPTCGYVNDGRRFLRQIEPFMDKLSIDPQALVRSC